MGSAVAGIGQVADKDGLLAIEVRAESAGALDRVSRVIQPCTPTASECSTGTGGPNEMIVINRTMDIHAF